MQQIILVMLDLIMTYKCDLSFPVIIASFFSSTISKKFLRKHSSNNYGELAREYHYTWPKHETEVCVEISRGF